MRAAAPEQEQTGPSKSAAPPLAALRWTPPSSGVNPISDEVGGAWRDGNHRSTRAAGGRRALSLGGRTVRPRGTRDATRCDAATLVEIGRASCRERV